MTTTDVPPMTTLRELALAAAGPAALRAAIHIGLPEAVGDDPVPLDRLAGALSVDPGVLARLMRLLEHHGLFTASDDGYRHTPTSRLLVGDHPHSLRYWTLWATEPWTWAIWPDLADAVRSGRGVFEDRFGTDFFAHLHREWPESTEVFNRSQTELSTLAADDIAARLDLDGVRTLADVGGGRGHMLATLLERHPSLHGTLVDLPVVAASADARLLPGGALDDRASVVAGDCLDRIPVDADVYLFKSILEWHDDRSVVALRNAAAAGHEGSRIVVITNLVDDSPEMGYAVGVDLLLLLNTGGKRHTRAGVCAMFEKAGLAVDRVWPITTYLHAVEAHVGPDHRNR